MLALDLCHGYAVTRKCSCLPVLEPNLDLPGAEARNFASKSFSMSSIRMGLSSKLAHEEARLVVSKSSGDVSQHVRRNSYLIAYLNRFILRFCARSSAAEIGGFSSSLGPSSLPSSFSSMMISSPWGSFLSPLRAS